MTFSCNVLELLEGMNSQLKSDSLIRTTLILKLHDYII